MGKLVQLALTNHHDYIIAATNNYTTELTTEITSDINIIIDFTNATCVYDNTKLIINADIHPVIALLD